MHFSPALPFSFSLSRVFVPYLQDYGIPTTHTHQNHDTQKTIAIAPEPEHTTILLVRLSNTYLVFETTMTTTTLTDPDDDVP